MFFGATSFNQPLNDWDVSSVTNLGNLFMDATSFNQPLSDWDVSSVTNMFSMFHGATSFNQPLNDWDVIGGPITAFMFADATSFNQPLNDWDVSNITSLIQMFNGATSFNQSLSTWDVSSVTSMTDMLDNSALSVDNYDATLNAWALLSVQPNVTLGADGITYCAGATAQQSLIDTHSWVIDDAGANCSPLTIYDFMFGQQVGSELLITELFQKAINHLNATTVGNPSLSLMDFLKGTVVNNEIHMEYDLQALVDAINAGGVEGCTQSGASNYNPTATIEDGSCCSSISELALVTPNSGCSGDDGAIDITVNDYNPSTLYTVDWVGPDAFSSQSEDPNGLASGSYTVTITDPNNCTATATFEVGQNICFGNL
jgi:surface protein